MKAQLNLKEMNKLELASNTNTPVESLAEAEIKSYKQEILVLKTPILKRLWAKIINLDINGYR